jgi:precorrin-8X/cobalt-precorrin-8 methylmutase
LGAFDRYIAVDWSAANSPVAGKNSIWIGEAVRSLHGIDLRVSRNPRTRAEAMIAIEDMLLHALSRNERVMVGFDFGFGYPSGAARALTGESGWRAMWRCLADLVTDDRDNRSNRFEVAARLNLELADAGHHYWGHPQGREYSGLAATRPVGSYVDISERRIVEDWSKRPQPVWKLTGAGSVGSQSMLGIARLERLRADPRFSKHIAIWPFETGFNLDLSRPITVVEIYPSLIKHAPDIEPRDRAQVEATVVRFAELDSAGLLEDVLAAPPGLTDEQRQDIIAEEGWIVGIGRESLLRSPLPGDSPLGIVRQVVRPAADYLHDPEVIYAQSFSTIRAEADLSGLPAALRPVAIRMIHASGMIDLVDDIDGDPAIADAVRNALADHAPILCDSEMVRAGIIARNLPRGNELIVTLNEPTIPELLPLLGTRSAAAVELWRPHLAGAIVVIGNAPTALFHLLDMLAVGVPRPAAIIATPVGFVGAAESKARLAAESPVPYLTVRGRRGGSAIASAALNAMTGGEDA